ncbi:MAG: HpcH/HpaI aldolase/citrate lyase family protein [Burkholderiales bacterium]
MKPIRTALFAPGIKERVMTKAFESDADAVIFDLEDSVPAAAKAEARALVAQAIDRAHAAGSGPRVTVRVNASATGLLKDDLGAVVRPGLSAIFLPKAESIEELTVAAALLEWLEASQHMKSGEVEVILMIESALGVYRCFDMLKSSPRIATACIGSAQDGDLQTDLGCGWSVDGPELTYAKSKVLLDTRAAGKLYPLDGVFSNLNDEEALVRDSQISARIGYVGRTVIHPKQIAPVRKAYAVPAEQVAYYTRVVNEFEAAEKTGVAAITLDGKLVDYAMYSRAKAVLELAKLDR